MTDTFDNFIDSLISDDVDQLKAAPTKRENKVTFTCTACNGSGLWNGGRVNRHGNKKCNTCMGSGSLKTDPRKLRQRRLAAAVRKEDQRNAAREQNLGHDGLFSALRDASDWNSFAQSLVQQHEEGKVWTENQVAAARRMVAKIEANRAARVANAPSVDLQPIRDMFEAALANGHKRPTYRAEGLVINRAPDHGRNPGALYVKTEDGDYLGKVLGTSYMGKDDAAEALASIASNPLDAAIRYGRKTGRCACCGRELTNKLSVELGIGPICRDKWGL